jgi:hypothetical protein
MVNLYGLELDTRLRMERSRAQAETDRMLRIERSGGQPRWGAARRWVGDLLVRLGHWFLRSADPSGAKVAWAATSH